MALMPLSTTRWPHQHVGMFHLRLVNKMKLSVGEKITQKNLINEIFRGETVVQEALSVIFRCLCGAVGEKKRSVKMLTTCTVCVRRVHEAGAAVRAGSLFKHCN